MSPVNPVLFAATESIQNIQVVRNTNGVARYVVKYVVKKDEDNRITLGADFHSGARMNADEKFLHNTKITCSRINEEKALEKSKNRKRPSGRGIAHPDMQGRVLGHSDVVTDFIFVRVQPLNKGSRQNFVSIGGGRSLLVMLIQQNPTVHLFIGRKFLPLNGTSQRVNLYCTEITVVILWCHMIW